MSGEAFHNGELLLDDWVFPDDFNSEQLELFSAWISEGYEQFVDTDYSYIRWLEQYHPEALPPDRYTLYQACFLLSHHSLQLIMPILQQQVQDLLRDQRTSQLKLFQVEVQSKKELVAKLTTMQQLL